jgi:hypothetical protein
MQPKKLIARFTVRALMGLLFMELALFLPVGTTSWRQVWPWRTSGVVIPSQDRFIEFAKVLPLQMETGCFISM